MRRFLRGPGFYLILLIAIIFIVTLLDIDVGHQKMSYPELIREIENGNISKLRTVENIAIGVKKGSDMKIVSR